MTELERDRQVAEALTSRHLPQVKVTYDCGSAYVQDATGQTVVKLRHVGEGKYVPECAGKPGTSSDPVEFLGGVLRGDWGATTEQIAAADMLLTHEREDTGPADEGEAKS